MNETMKLFSLHGRRALITGSGRGIGLALARGLAGAGASIVINDRNEQKAADLAADLRGEGFDAGFAVFDVTDREQVVAAIERVEKTIGAIDILINNAGIQRRAPLENFDEGDWNDLLRVNLDGVFQVSQAVARHMLARGRGKIINIGSVQSELARPGIAPYAATKGAIRMLTKGMCADLGPFGIQINGLAPGYIATELTAPLIADEEFDAWLRARTPAGRWGRVDDLVGPLLFLVSPAADYVNGQILTVDGGMLAVL